VIEAVRMMGGGLPFGTGFVVVVVG